MCCYSEFSSNYANIIFIFVCFTTCVVSSGPAPDFSTYTLVQPTLQHARTKRDLSSTRDKGGVHHSEVIVSLDMGGERRELELRLNTELIADGHVVRYQRAGRTLVHKPTKEELDLCQYWGSVRGSPGSWAAVSTCRGLRGAIYDGTHMRYIEPAHDDDIQSPHYLYSHTDLNTTYDPLHMKLHADKELNRSRVTRYKRNVEESSVHSPYNANSQSRYVELVLVADRRQFEASRGDLRTVHSQMIELANIINSIYAPLNIFIALVGVDVWTEYDEILLDEESTATLSRFLEYREKKLARLKPNDNAQLLTLQKFDYGIVGKALPGVICTAKQSGGIVKSDHASTMGLLAAAIAHEMGHNFGMSHDNGDCTCPQEPCVMDPTAASVTPTHWSSCSLRSLALAFERGMDYCLRNKPKLLLESPTCGNGFVESGEQCDCGLVSGEEHTACTACCDPRTCMLRSNATCGAGACCDVQTCRPRAAGAVCRAAERECDLPEYCSGHSEFCPGDVFKMDSTPCGTENQAYCVQGSCRSHSDQCRLLWGTTGESSHDNCYTKHNIMNNKNGNCGYDRLRQVFRPCAEEDARCGLLQCRHLNEQLEFGMQNSYNIPQHKTFVDEDILFHCFTIMVDLGNNDVDPGMVPDGAKCGHDKMCLKQRCVPVSVVRDEISQRTTSVCPTDCSGHGVCNSEGHCHCDQGFAPPLCKEPGPGGSVDSGPATYPQVQRNFMVAMYVIFLGIVPAVVLALFLYYSRRHVLLWWRKLTNARGHIANNHSRSITSIGDPMRNNVTTNNDKELFHEKLEPVIIQNQSVNQHTQDKSRNKPVHVNLHAHEKNWKKPVQGMERTDIDKVKQPGPPVQSRVTKEIQPNEAIAKQGLVSISNEMLASKINRLKTTR